MLLRINNVLDNSVVSHRQLDSMAGFKISKQLVTPRLTSDFRGSLRTERRGFERTFLYMTLSICHHDLGIARIQQAGNVPYDDKISFELVSIGLESLSVEQVVYRPGSPCMDDRLREAQRL